MREGEGIYTSLKQLYCQHALPLNRYARRSGSNAEEAEDHVQNAFMRLLEGKMPPSAPVMSWLYCVVYREVLLAHRRGLRRCRREQQVSKSEVWFSEFEDHLDAVDATCLLSELPGDLREVIVSHIWDGRTFEEIAESAGCSAATAYRRYQTGLIRLREKFEER